MTAPLSNGETRHLLECWSKYVGPFRHQIDGFDHFVKNLIPEITTENSAVTVDNAKRAVSHRVTFKAVRVRSPTIREVDGSVRNVTPSECRTRCLSYLMSIYADVVHSVTNSASGATRTVEYREMLICRMPCMVGCAACTLVAHPPEILDEDTISDGGGARGAYFVVFGNEKVLIMQEHIQNNKVFVRRSSNGTFIAETRSRHSKRIRSTSTMSITYSPKASHRFATLTVALPFLDCGIQLATLIRLFGVSCAEEAVRIVDRAMTSGLPSRDEVLSVFRRAFDGNPVWSETVESIADSVARSGTIETNARRRSRYIQHLLNCETLPSQGVDGSEETARAKVIFLLIASVKLVRVALGHLPEDDRDDYAIKRVDDPGMLCALLYRQLFRGFLKSLTLQIHRSTEAGRDVNIMDTVTHRRMTSGFRYAFTTGMWGIHSSQCGVVQLLTRQTVLASVSHRRRINTPVNRDGKLQKPRELSDSHYGIICPVETPEGQSCGLVENLAMLAVVRIGVDGDFLTRLLLNEGYIKRDLALTVDHWHVFVNGVYEGACEDGPELCAELRRVRRAAGLPACVSVYCSDQERSVFVESDAGALHQPLIRVEALDRLRRMLREVPPPLLWGRLVAEGCVELMTKMEEKNAAIGETHVHVHPSCMFGVCGGQIPFPDHNQAPRNIYGSAMTKQAVGVFVADHEERFDCNAHVLHYPQVPLVQTMLQDAQGAEAYPCGVNIVLAILSHTGFSQEDAIVVNRDSVERGLFHSSIYRSYRDEERDASLESFGPPLAQGLHGLRHGDYSKLQSDGFPSIGSVISNGDAIIGKTTRRVERGQTHVSDASTFLKSFEDMRVDKVCLTSSKSGARLARVRMHALRAPQVGDKFSSHHGQKGVVGLLMPGADMPFSRDGWCPDMMICPFCIPSRMTFGQLIEMLLGKASCLSQRLGDGTPFEGTTVEEIGRVLAEHGYESRGNETLYNGTTGERFETSVFVGPCHYQRLKHMVADKVHARNYGPRTMLTRQPVEGRSRMGGTRVGEMEKDCFASHGASSMLLDRLLHCSDEFQMPVCSRCGTIAERIAEGSFAVPGRRAYCRSCRGGDVVAVRCPYAFKLFVQEVAALNISMRLTTAPRISD